MKYSCKLWKEISFLYKLIVQRSYYNLEDIANENAEYNKNIILSMIIFG